MSAPVPQQEADAFFNQIADIGCYDSERLNGQSFRAKGLVHKMPRDSAARAANAAILICTGHLEDGKQELETAYGLSTNAHFAVKAMIATLLRMTGQHHKSSVIYRHMLKSIGKDLAHPEYRELGGNIAANAILGGDIDLLKAYIEVTQHKPAQALHNIVQELDLSETLKAHQDAVNAVLGNVMAMSGFDMHYDPESDDQGLILQYSIPENLYDGRALRRDVFDAVEKAEASIGKEPGYFSTRITVDIMPLPVVGHLQAA